MSFISLPSSSEWIAADDIKAGEGRLIVPGDGCHEYMEYPPKMDDQSWVYTP